MLRRSIIRLSPAKSGRTIVRDPRKNKRVGRPSSEVQVQNEGELQADRQFPKPATPPIPFAPPADNQDGGVGSTLGSYVLAGVGVTLGFTVVKLVFGV
mmetsp:Transcript_11586/g.14600  ORF Transcript_11586/g.14600 Transcript_11586/m.14600 type:complete len:98 (+) Transcript_11586:58-351(+)